jgi:sulfate transport system substrate-binding protein
MLGRRAAAVAYLKFLYPPDGQEVVAKHHSGAGVAGVAKRYETSFAKTNLITIDGAFGGWQKAQKEHFADGGTFDQIYQPGS